ncbi:Dps family protein [Haloplasma contractile]|nr:DNA starvation/stationary phase protection protein [Haloplasma contractile]
MNKQLSNWTVLYMKLHNYHWFVKGKDFFTLHEKFEEFYDEAAKYIDELAERQLMLNNKPLGTLKECLSTSSITEGTYNETPSQMVQAIIHDFNTIINESKTAITAAEEQKDDATADLFIGIIGSLEKHNWMLKTFLQE